MTARNSVLTVEAREAILLWLRRRILVRAALNPPREIQVLTEMLMDELDYLLAELDRNAFTAVAAKEPAAETAAVSEPVAEALATRQIV